MQHDPSVDSHPLQVDSQLSHPPSSASNSGGSPTLDNKTAAPAEASATGQSSVGTDRGTGEENGASKEGGEGREPLPSTTSPEGVEAGTVPVAVAAGQGALEGGKEIAAGAKESVKGEEGKVVQEKEGEDRVGRDEKEETKDGAGDAEGGEDVSNVKEENQKEGEAKEPVLAQPTPSNPSAAAAAADALLAPSTSSSVDSSSSPASAADAGESTPPAAATNGASSSTLAPTAPLLNPSPSVSPAPSTSPAPPSTTSTSAATPIAAPHPQKKFQSSLAVNKKFLEKAGEKSKPEVKPVATRLATPPIPTPISASHPRLFAGKLSSSSATPSSSITLSTSSSTPSLGLGTGGWKKPASPAPPASSSAAGPSSSLAAGMSPTLALGGRASGAPVWGSKLSAGGGAGFGPGGRVGAGGMMGDFPTAAEAAHAKEARARALLEQMQARERAMQARAAAAAAQNAHLLEGLDAFRGVHLDPNAAHWDEDEDDFLDTTIEFADGTQYKIVEEANGTTTPAAAEEDELREPGPNELALREKPLAPGEVVEPPRREERFGDDFDRSWPRRDGAAGGGGSAAPSHNLFNARLGQFEPAAKRGAGAEPTSILSARERRTSGGMSDLPPPASSSHSHHEPASRRRGSFTSPPRGRRLSITSPPTRTGPLPGVGGGAGRRESFGDQQQQKPPPSAWARRPSTETQNRLLPPHLAGSAGGGGAGGRQLPPHLQQQQSHAAQQPPSLLSPPARNAALSPPTQRGAPLPPLPSSAASALSPTAAAGSALAPTTSTAPAPAAAATPPPAPAATAEPDLEATHHREMHAAAERAKKRREEEEQARLEQKERARKKALELEERMKKVEEEKVAKDSKEKEGKEKAAAPAAQAVVSPPAVPVKSASEAVGSWRQAAKPLPPQAAVAPQPAAVPTKILAREAAVPPAAASSSSFAAPPPSASSAAPAPPTQPSAWRRPLVQPAASASRAPLHQLPPHMQQQTVPPPPAAPAPASASSAQSSSAPPAADKAPASPPPATAPTATSPAVVPPAKPATPPATIPPAAPASPSQERKAAAKPGYKVPAVSQFEDLMSRIKGAMTAPAETARPAAEVVEPAKPEPKETPIVKLPGNAAPPSSATPPSAPTPPNAPPTVSLPVPTEPRGRGRGRTVTPRAPRVAQPPIFEDREPLLPFPSTRIARSHSPPPAWRQYTVRLAPYPPRRPPNHRVLKNFSNLHHPRPVPAFTFEPPMAQINTNRLTRDDWLMPKRYSKGVVQYSVQLPTGKFDERRRAAAAATAATASAAPKPTVSVSAKQLKRAAAPPIVEKVEPLPVQTPPATAIKPEQITFSPFGPPEDGNGKTLANGTTWGQPSTVPTASLDDVQVAAETAEAVLATDTAPETSPSRARLPHKKLPEGSSIGFYRLPGSSSLDGGDSPSAKMFMVTSELNGEKVEMTPRKETTAPGAHLSASTGKSPSSPVFRQPDMDGLMSSPSSSSAWPTKSLVLNPTVASVWSTPPDENPVHARTISGVRPENSLQGIVDEDPSVALPNSLAELKSEDGLSLNEDKDSTKPAPAKDEAKLRAVAPSFSSFLHEKAASIDTGSAPTSEAQGSPVATASRPPLPPSFSSFNPQLPPHPSPSPVNAYSPAQPYSPQLHPSLQAYNRPLSQQQLYPSYPVASQSASPFAPHSSYSPQPFAPQSPALQAVGYPSSPYRDPTQPPAPPQHITNPALLANYGYGQPVSANSSPSRNFGAVGAGGPGPIGRPGSGAAFPRPPLPTSYISSGYASPYQPPQLAPSPAYRAGEPSYGYSSGMGGMSQDPSRAPHQAMGGGGIGGGYSASTMASPVIMPQQPPQVPHFGPGSPAHSHQHLHQHYQHHQHQHSGNGYPIHQHQQGLPSAVQQAAGIPPYAGTPQPGSGQGGYGAPGGYGRGLPQSRQGGRAPMGAAGFGGRGW